MALMASASVLTSTMSSGLALWPLPPGAPTNVRVEATWKIISELHSINIPLTAKYPPLAGSWIVKQSALASSHASKRSGIRSANLLAC